MNRPVLRKVKHKGEATIGEEVTSETPNTVDFIKKTLDLLDSLKSSTNKYNTVAKQQGVNRSLVFKWEKDRSKLHAELTLTMTKKNTGSARPMRQRRRIAGNRSRRTDQYPLASNLLLA